MPDDVFRPALGKYEEEMLEKFKEKANKSSLLICLNPSKTDK